MKFDNLRKANYMVCNKVTYGGQVLLTVYHNGFDNEINDRRLKIVQKVGLYNLVFTETLVSDDEIDNISGWIMKEEGLLAPDSSKNPYSSASCAYMVHYEYINKPNKLFCLYQNKYILAIPVEKFLLVNEFIKKYIGIDIEKTPMIYGDIFVFNSYAYNYHSNKEHGIIIERLPLGSMVIIRFKKDEAIVSTKIFHVEHETSEIEIKSNKPWTYHDIEIYFNGELIYFDKDVSYMRRMQLNMHLTGSGKRVKLNKIADSYIIQRNDGGQITCIGDSPDEFEELMHNSSTEINRRLSAEHPDNQISFMKPGELKKAVDLIGNAMQMASETIWIFDSYFTDINGSNSIVGMLDWIHILTNCRAQSKNVVFYCKGPNNALDLQALKTEIERDGALSAILRTRNKLGIHFYQTKSPIHDRFVLTESDRIYSGLAMGTSFNSLGDHHYCIYKLTHKASQTIWSELKSWMVDGSNLLADEGV